MPRKEEFDILTVEDKTVATEPWVEGHFSEQVGNISHDDLIDVSKYDHLSIQDIIDAVLSADGPLDIDISGEAGETKNLTALESIDGDISNGKELKNIAGENLSIDSSGNLNGLGTGSEGLTGLIIKDGDGTKTTFSGPHGFDTEPSYVHVDAQTEDASADYWITYDDTSIYINYASAPESGNNNLQWTWAVTADSGVNLGDITTISHDQLNNVNPGQHRTDQNVVNTIEQASPLNIDITGSSNNSTQDDNDDVGFNKKTFLEFNIRSPNIMTHGIRLKDGEQIYLGPYRCNSTWFEVWRWGIMMGDLGADQDLLLQFINKNNGVVAETHSNEEVGDIQNDEPITKGGFDSPRFRIVNNTGSPVVASAFVSTYEQN